MSYFFRVCKEDLYYKNNELQERSQENFFIFSKNLNSEEVEDFISAYKKNNLKQFVDKIEKNFFFFCLYDKSKKNFYVFNDHFSSNDVLYFQKNGKLIVSNDIKAVCREENIKPEIDIERIYEAITFYTILPPKTVYKKIFSLPLGSCLNYFAISENLEIVQYWDFYKYFKNKEGDYERLIENIRNELKTSIARDGVDKMAVALSGGIDSGGLIGLIKKTFKVSLPSITIGAYGPDTYDLKSSRHTAKFIGSKNYEIYPKFCDLKKLKFYLSGINQPLDGHFVLANCLIFDKAQEISINKIAYGNGSEMLLGNLKIFRLAHTLEKIEPWVPFSVLRGLYKIIAKFKKFSKNQTLFLLTDSWIDRFFIARGPLFHDIKRFFLLLPDNFMKSQRTGFNRVLHGENFSLVDKLTAFYLNSWVNYMQMREFMILSKKYKILPVMPFDTSNVAEELFRTPNKFRRLGKWDKQVIRDVFRPFVTDQLYKNKGRSMIFPFNKWFQCNYEKFIGYLRTNDIISRAIDLDKLEKEYEDLLEPGLIMVRLVGIALWYDLNWRKENVKNFDKIFE